MLNIRINTLKHQHPGNNLISGLIPDKPLPNWHHFGKISK